MKKMFFTVLVAIVSIDGVVSAQEDTAIYPESSNSTYFCVAFAAPSCLNNVPKGRLYSDPLKMVQINHAELLDLYFIGIY